MAFKRRLDLSWTLTDGILDPFPVGGARDIASAVVAAGYAADPLVGMNLAAIEWIYSRRWIYLSAFETPQEGEERVYLLFEHLFGRGEVWVNGVMAGRFKGGEVMLDVSGLIAESGDNELKVCFEPVYRALPGDNPMPMLGLGEGVWLKAISGLTMAHGKAVVSGETARFEYALNVHVPGLYTFKYTVSLDGELIKRAEVIERFAAAHQLCAHDITMEHPRPYDPENGDETTYDVDVSIERGALGCERAHFELLFSERASQKRGVLVYGALTAEAARDIRTLGACSVGAAWPQQEESETRFGLFYLKENTPHRLLAPVSAERWAIERGNRDWFDAPMQRLRGGRLPLDEAKVRYGAAVIDKPERLIRLLRAQQACEVMRYAFRRRREDREAVFEWNMPWEALCGASLTERGVRRPAWLALREVWRETMACAELPEGGVTECGIQIKLPIWLMSDRAESGLTTVTACVISALGEVIASGEYSSALGRVRRAGTLAVDLPPCAGAYVVRCEVKEAQGRVLSCCDDILCVYDEAETLGALASLDEAVLVETGRGSVRNEGETVAFAAGRSLLPGETDEPGEWINARLNG